MKDLLFFEYEIHCCNPEKECQSMLLSTGFILKYGCTKDHENDEGYDLLNDLQLHERKGASVTLKTHPVGRNLKAIFEECNFPAKKDNCDELQ